MALIVNFTKKLAAASSNNIAQSQSASAGVALTLNGSTTPYLSTTSSAAVAAGQTVIPLTSVSGLVVGEAVTDSTASVIPTNTFITGVGTSGISISQPVGGVGIGSGDTIVLTGPATIDTYNASTNSAPGRRVVIAYTGTDTSFTIVGTNATGNPITDVAVGASGSAQSNLDFVTVNTITPVGGGLTGVTAGTNGVGSSQWFIFNWHGYSPMSIGTAVELVTGSANFTVQYTYDDPNNLPTGVGYPLAFNSGYINGATATIDGAQPNLTNGVMLALRLLINSGTGGTRARFDQAGAG